MSNATTQATTIPISTTTSEAIYLGGEVLCGIAFPAAMTGTSVSFQVNIAGTYRAVYDDTGALLTVTVTASAFVPIYTDSFMGAKHLKIVSNASEAAARTLYVVARAMEG